MFVITCPCLDIRWTVLINRSLISITGCFHNWQAKVDDTECFDMTNWRQFLHGFGHMEVIICMYKTCHKHWITSHLHYIPWNMHIVLLYLVLSYSMDILLHYNDVIMGTIESQITSLTIVYSIVYSDADEREQQSSASLAFVRGIHREPVNSPHKWPVTRKMFPFDDVIIGS